LLFNSVAAADYPVKYLGIDQGLSNNAVTSIYQDYRGFMWFGTYDGLNRFDGYNFTVFRNIIGDSTSLSTNNIFALDGDSHHNIWIGGQKGANVFDPVQSTFSIPRFITLNHTDAHEIQDDIHAVKAIDDGTVLLGSKHNGLLVFEHYARTGFQVPLPGSGNANYNVTAIAYDQQRKLIWVFIQQAGLFQYDLASHSLRTVDPSILQANCLKVNRQGNLWLGTDNGLYQYNLASHRFSGNFIPARSNVVSLCEDRNQVLWVASDGDGVWLLPEGATQTTPFLASDQTPVVNSNAVYAIYEDIDGRKWIGTLRGGINMIDSRPLSFTHITYNKAGSHNPIHNFILSFCEDEHHNVWIGTDGAGVRYWNRHNNSFTEYTHHATNNHSISSNFITSITRDAQNSLWISTWFGGINRLQKNSTTFEHYTCYNPQTHAVENNVWQVYEDQQQNIWASATNDGSLYLLNRSKNQFEMFDASIVDLQSLAEDQEGNFWGGNYTSLIRIDRIHKKHVRYPIGYPVRCIHEDKSKHFWLGTQGGGLLRFDRTTGTFKQFTSKDGLPGNTILRLLEDKKGYLWLSTYNGLCKFNPTTQTCQNFSPSDGLQSNQFSFNAGLALQSGEFLFGGIKGFNVFFPDSVYNQTVAPPVFLSRIKINNNPVEAHPAYITGRTMEKINQVTIPYDQAVLSLDFIALEYTRSDKVKYAYYLEGWDKDWNYVNGIRTANYSRLQEGSYTFQIKVTNPDGRWSESTQLLKIIVLPPWYRTWWAYLLYIACAAGIIYIYLRYTKRQERLKYEIKLAHLENEKDKELTEKKLSFFTNISHEFRTPLTLIINPLKEKLHTALAAADNDLTIAYRNARRLLSLVDQLLLFRKADSGEDTLNISAVNIIELCREVYQCFIQQAKVKNIDYRFTHPAASIEIHADYEKIEIALFNLLSNAFKFTPDGGTIVVEISETTTDVHLIVQDNGCGIDYAEQQKIFEKFQQAPSFQPAQTTGFGIGLYLVKHFVESHQGKVTCNSIPEKGTCFTITLQKGTAHLPANYHSHQAVHKHEWLQELAGATTALSPDSPVALPEQGKTAEEVVTDKKSILFVDDNEEIRQYLQHLLEKKYLLYTADNGNDGYQLAEKHVPDLIISDIHMKGMDGLEMCQLVKQSEKTSHIPVILLTAATGTDTRLKGIEGGADDYITKPFDTDLLLARVETILRNRNLLQRYFFDSITLKETTIKVPAEYQEFLRSCIAIIEENIDRDDFTIKKFAQAIGMSQSGLYQKIKSISGQSPNAFIRSIRLRRAAVLLLTGDLNISQAAFQVGIGDARYFREQFVKLFGMTPSLYIRKYRPAFNNTHHTIKTATD
jgi:signal transduction histidine kinase/ligand-binding sensor domain-containing protein/CheY-like chemotaxis protein/AraC-like DNA-binding protein